MEHIRVAKVENIQLLRRGEPTIGTLHIAQHHIIFRFRENIGLGEGMIALSSANKQGEQREIWITYPIIAQATRHGMSLAGYSSIRLRCKDFTFMTFQFSNDQECRDVFDSIKALSCGRNIERLYAFYYVPPPPERSFDGWKLYDAIMEYKRMGIATRNQDWRISKINNNYTFCSTYPAHLVVPATVSDNVLNYAAKFRSRARIPVLTYLHPLNNCTITRSSQPLAGIKGNRSPQDEKLVAAIFSSSQASSFTNPYYEDEGFSDLEGDACIAAKKAVPSLTENRPRPVVYGAQQRNLIVDARPAVNAYAMQAIGMGSENMDNYKNCTRQFLGIDNIHVMRDSLSKVIEAIKDSDITPFPVNRELLAKSGWLKHIGLLLDGTNIIVKQIAICHSHVLIHCSDGWDRTSQLSALAQICLDPYYRTIDGFITLVEKDWLSFGHRFRDRSGFLGHEKWFIEKEGSGSHTAATVNGPGGSTSGVTGIGGGVEAAFSQAKLFFQSQASNLTNGGRNSPSNELDSDADTLGHGSSSVFAGEKKSKHSKSATGINVKEISPMFHQFLDATYQILYQYPTRFEFNERFLRRLLYHLYSCQYGTFLYNNEKERFVDHKAHEKTKSVWNYFLARRQMWLNPKYDKTEDSRDKGGWSVLFPAGVGKTRWWSETWGRPDDEMNGPVTSIPALSEMEVLWSSEKKTAEDSIEESSDVVEDEFSSADPGEDEEGQDDPGDEVIDENTEPQSDPLGAARMFEVAATGVQNLSLGSFPSLGIGAREGLESSRGTSPTPNSSKPVQPMELEMT